MNAPTATLQGTALALAATNADILRAIRDGQHLTAGAIGHACGRPTKNMARDVAALVRAGLVHQEDAPSPREVGAYELTAAGVAALHGVDLAQGLGAPPAGDSGDILLTHDQIRPNPLNPRKHFPKAEIEALAETIDAAGEVLQNLVVFPADAEGVHTLADGERRWRAVGLLIEQGRWPAARRLRALQRENTAGQTSFLALVANGTGEKLALIEEARAYLTVVEETGWSARQAALKAGRDVKTVQEMLKVLREADPADIAAHEADPKDFTWERLRNSVKEARAPEPAPQLDIEELTTPKGGLGPMLGGGNVAHPPKPLKGPAGPDEALTTIERVTMLEVANRLQLAADRQDAEGVPLTKARRYWLDQTASDLTSKGLIVFTHQYPEGPHVALLKAGRAWVEANIDLAEIMAVEPPYATPWLNVEAATEPVGDGPQPAPAPAVSDEDEAVGLDEVAARELLADVSAFVNETREAGYESQGAGFVMLFDRSRFAELLQRAGVRGPFRAAVDPSHTTIGNVVDIDGNDFLTVDADSAFVDAQARAGACLVSLALNASLGCAGFEAA